jgi:hypothetical protein
MNNIIISGLVVILFTVGVKAQNESCQPYRRKGGGQVPNYLIK